MHFNLISQQLQQKISLKNWGILVLSACLLETLPGPDLTRARSSSDDAVVTPKASTTPVKHDADDCAIWVNPADQSKGIIIGTDKGENGGLYVWLLNGQPHQFVPLTTPNNVDVRYNMMIGGQALDIAVVNLRASKELKIYKIDPDSSKLVDLTCNDGIKTPELEEPYGLCLYRRPHDGAMFVITSTKYGDKGNLHQYRLEDDGHGKVKGTYVRAFGNNSIEDKVEGLVADDELGYVYASDETKAVRKYYADPDLKKNEQITAFAQDGGFEGDREGIDLYTCPDGTGYLLVSSQDNSSLMIYRREGEKGNPHEHDLVAKIVTAGAAETDGLEVTNLPAGTDFPKGLLVKHNSDGRNFALFSWEEVARDRLKVCAETAPANTK